MKPALPPSDTHLGTNLLGYFSALAALFLLKDSGFTALDKSFLVLLAGVAPIAILDVFVFRRYREASAGLSATRQANQSRVLVKCLGLIGIFLIFGAGYALLPEYHRPFYRLVWPFYLTLLPLLFIGAPFYFLWCDARQSDPEDGYYHLGRLLTFRWRETSTYKITRLLRDWLVKAFFLPLMFTFSVDAIHGMQIFELGESPNFIQIFLLAQAIIMFGDLLYATIGYVFTFRIFNAHIRSSEPTFLGWFVALMCYYPFWQLLFFNSFFRYDDGRNWDVLIPQGLLQYGWGIAILCLYTVYALATICLGIRFSNLTYRGLVTNGPYRFTKHPAYVSKNLSWWLVSIPFISYQGITTAIMHTAALTGIGVIYFLRARTEERHLSNYPEYVAYAEAMNERSIFAPLAKRLPFLRYVKPENPPKI